MLFCRKYISQITKHNPYQTSTQLTTLKMPAIKNISLYIPHIFANFTVNQVTNIFESQEIGKVKRVDLIEKMGKDNKVYNAAYIHFDRWYNNAIAKSFQERVLSSDREARIMYDDPWYWIVLPNTTKKHPPSGSRKIKIDLTSPSTPPSSPLSTPPSTPPSNKKRAVCPGAPRKPTYSSILMSSENDDVKSFNLEDEYHFSAEPTDAELDEMEKHMDEIDTAIEYDNQFLTTVDSRYIYTIEQENLYLRYQVSVLQSAIYAEAIQAQENANMVGMDVDVASEAV